MDYIELLSGDLLRKDIITAVRLGDEIVPDGELYSTHHKPRVIVDFGPHGNCIVTDFETAEQRDEYANELKLQLRGGVI